MCHNDTAIISVSETNQYVNLKDGWTNVLRLHFSDLDNRFSFEKNKYIDKGFVFFEEFHAKEILYFIKNLPVSIETILVHCEVGISRSAAIRKALSEYYGLNCDWKTPVGLDWEYFSYEEVYNKMVYEELNKILKPQNT